MELDYLVAIVVGGVFVLFFLIFLVLAAYREQKHEERMALIEKTYASPELLKMEYDTAFYDDEVADKLFGGNRVETQVTIEDVLTDKSLNQSLQQESVFSKIDVEGLEEITGNYIEDF